MIDFSWKNKAGLERGLKMFAGVENSDERVKEEFLENASNPYPEAWCEVCDWTGTEAAWRKHVQAKHGWSASKADAEWKKGMENSEKENALGDPGQGFRGQVGLDNRSFDGKKLVEPKPCPKCFGKTVLVDTTTGLCKSCFDKDPASIENATTRCKKCGCYINTAFGKDAPAKHAGAFGTVDDPRAPGDRDDVCATCDYAPRKNAAFEIEDAKSEVQSKSTLQINEETAHTWAARAAACYDLAAAEPDRSKHEELLARANDFKHEALEHAALIEDGGKLVGEIQGLMKNYPTNDTLVNSSGIFRGEKRYGTVKGKE